MRATQLSLGLEVVPINIKNLQKVIDNLTPQNSSMISCPIGMKHNLEKNNPNCIFTLIETRREKKPTYSENTHPKQMILTYLVKKTKDL